MVWTCELMVRWRTINALARNGQYFLFHTWPRVTGLTWTALSFSSSGVLETALASSVLISICFFFFLAFRVHRAKTSSMSIHEKQALPHSCELGISLHVMRPNNPKCVFDRHLASW